MYTVTQDWKCILVTVVKGVWKCMQIIIYPLKDRHPIVKHSPLLLMHYYARGCAVTFIKN